MISLHLMGGLGNQLFQYATLKSLMLENKQTGIVELSKISGFKKRGHNIYALNKFNIDKNILVKQNEKNIRLYINYIVYIFYCIFFKSKKMGLKFIKKVQPCMNKIGCYCIPDGYLKIKKMNNKKNYLFGYFQSLDYFEKYSKEIRKDLKVITPILDQNKEILDEIENTNSVCVHIRRGDYVGTEYDVCNIKYYIEAMNLIKQKIPNCKFYIFSNDIEWVKENIKFDNIKYVNNKNPGYEELRLMYSCKHFIMSNSSFSWWAQFLSDNTEKIVVAPSKWMKNKDNNLDIYCDYWKIVQISEE